MGIIIKPLVTEKMTAITDKTNNRFGFIVRPEANKLEIKKEVEALYNVTVVDVNTMKYAFVLRTVCEYMSQMSVTAFTAYFRPEHSIRSIFFLCNQVVLNRFGEARPSTTRIELVSGNKQWLTGSNIDIDTRAMLVPIFVMECWFSSAFLSNSVLFCR